MNKKGPPAQGEASTAAVVGQLEKMGEESAHPGITKIPQTEEEAVRNRAHTKMTSNMIKASLKDMRDKLSKMKHNKEVMAVGMKKLDGDFLNTKTELDK